MANVATNDPQEPISLKTLFMLALLILVNFITGTTALADTAEGTAKDGTIPRGSSLYGFGNTAFGARAACDNAITQGLTPLWLDMFDDNEDTAQADVYCYETGEALMLNPNLKHMAFIQPTDVADAKAPNGIAKGISLYDCEALDRDNTRNPEDVLEPMHDILSSTAPSYSYENGDRIVNKGDPEAFVLLRNVQAKDGTKGITPYLCTSPFHRILRYLQALRGNTTQADVTPSGTTM